METQAPDIVAYRRFEREGWDRAAGAYEAVWAPLTGQFLPALLDAAGIARGQRVLDVACGPGVVAAAAAARGAEVVAVDLSPEMVELARRRLPHVEVRESSAEALDVADASFDRVLVGFGLHHFAAPDTALHEAARVLRPGGRLAFTVWGRPAESPYAAIMEAATQAHALPVESTPTGPDVSAFADSDRCRALLARAGFDAGSVSATLHHGLRRLSSAEDAFDQELRHGVRCAALLRGQTEARRAAIRAAVAEAVAAYALPDGAGYAVPITAWVIAADRP